MQETGLEEAYAVVGAERRAARQLLDRVGKAWAFAQAIGCLDYYRVTNPAMSQTAVRTLKARLADEPAPGP